MSTLRLEVCKKLRLSATASQTDIYRAALKKIALSGQPAVGDRVQVNFGGNWRDGVVTKVAPDPYRPTGSDKIGIWVDVEGSVRMFSPVDVRSR